MYAYILYPYLYFRVLYEIQSTFFAFTDARNEGGYKWLQGHEAKSKGVR